MNLAMRVGLALTAVAVVLYVARPLADLAGTAGIGMVAVLGLGAGAALGLALRK